MGKTKKQICSHPECKKKIGVVDALSSKCKCGNTYCLTHRLPEKHNCSYNYSDEVDFTKEVNKMKCVAVYDKI